MNWRALILFLAASPAFADSVDDAIARGRAARADGVPQAAIADLKRAAARNSAPALVELVRCLLQSGRSAAAVEWTRRTLRRDEPEVTFWRAQALASNGNYAAALEDYRRAAQADPGLCDATNIGEARMLEALGQIPEAQKVYARISPSSDRYVAAQLARAAMFIFADQRSEAKAILESLKPKSDADRDRRRYLMGCLELDAGRDTEKHFGDYDPRDPRLAAGGTIGEAEALTRKKEIEKAESELESFIRGNPHNPLINDLFAKLDEVRGREKNPANGTLKQWRDEESNRPLASSASFLLARTDERAGRADRAIRGYQKVLDRYGDQEVAVPAAIRLARLLIAGNQTEAARGVLQNAANPGNAEDRARLQFLRGMTEYQSRNFVAASREFVGAANVNSEVSRSALANAALAAIVAGRDPMAAEILNALRRESASDARRIELAQAFVGARSGQPDVVEQLSWVANQGGDVGNRARLALSEWRWREGDRAGAQSDFLRVSNRTAGSGDQKDYFAIYLADDGSKGAAAAVAAAANAFLDRYPNSPREADVRMKWGEVLMRTGDYRGARAQFDGAAQSTTDDAIRQSATLLSARAAAGSMAPEELEAAILSLEDVASDKSSELAPAARWEQATLQSALGRPEESVKILDRLIAITDDPRLQFAARLKKADALLTLGRTQPERIKDAIAEWSAIAAAPGVLPAERNEALTHAAAASEQAGDFDGAIAAYYEVLTTPRDRQPEYFWYYKAGFAVANLLHKRNRLEEEAAIYEKMAAVPGPQAAEAAERVKRLRLENFIWNN